MTQKLRNIKRYKLISNNKILFIDTTFHIRTYPENKYLGSIDNASDIYSFNDKIIIIENYYGKAFLIDCNGMSPFWQNEYSFAEIVGNNAIVYWDDNDSNSYFGIFDMQEARLLFKERDIMHHRLLSPTTLVCYNSTEIFLFNDIHSRNKLHLSISNLPIYIDILGREQSADIKHVIGTYKDIFWIHIGGFRLVGVDINTGVIIHYIENVLKGGNDNNFLDPTKGIIITLSHDYYAEYDLNSLTFIKKTQIGTSQEITITKSTYYENDKYLYFSGYYHKAKYPNVFGMFDRQKEVITWYDIAKEKDQHFFNPPQGNDKLLTILDNQHNLLIYEKENIKIKIE